MMVRVKRKSNGMMGESNMRAHYIFPIGWCVIVYHHQNYADAWPLNDIVEEAAMGEEAQQEMRAMGGGR